MDLSYTAAEEEFRAELRTWLADNVPGEWRRPGFWASLPDDESFRLRRDWERAKADAGFAGIQWPVEYGGRGGTPGMKAIYDEEMVLADAPRTVNALGLTFLAPTVMAIGTDAQKKEIIGPMLRNEVIWCQGFSEPGAGSDLAALACRGVRDGDDFVVNGQKVWTTNAVHGDKIFAMVRTDPGSERHRGISMLLIDMHQPGVDARPLKQMSGASEFGEVFFTDARVPATEVLGDIDDGWRTAMLLLSFERGASGISQYTEFRRQYDAIVDLARDARPPHRPGAARPARPRAHRPGVPAAALDARAHPGRAGPRPGVRGVDDQADLVGDVPGPLGGLRRPARRGRHARRVARRRVDLRPLHAQSMWSRSVTIWGGSSQVQRNVTAERVLGLPR